MGGMGRKGKLFNVNNGGERKMEEPTSKWGRRGFI
jgi:hypothetical protein